MKYIAACNFDAGKGCEGKKGEEYKGGDVEKLLADGFISEVKPVAEILEPKAAAPAAAPEAPKVEAQPEKKKKK